MSSRSRETEANTVKGHLNRTAFLRSQLKLNRSIYIEDRTDSGIDNFKGSATTHGKTSPTKTDVLPTVFGKRRLSPKQKEIPQSCSTQGVQVLERNAELPNNMNKNAKIDNNHSGQQLSKRVLESPLANMYCTGQRLQTEGNWECLSKRKEVSEVGERSLGECVKISRNPIQPPGTQSIPLNKLYSSLKKLKSRREVTTEEQMNKEALSRCSNFPFIHRKGFEQCGSVTQGGGYDEIFILLGGKSKPVRFEVNPENLNLLESEFGLQLKSRTLNPSLDEEDFELLRKFREKYRNGISGKQSPFIPWARHAILKRDMKHWKERSNSVPSATYNIEEEEFGRKLSIHVYLPNIQIGEASSPSP